MEEKSRMEMVEVGGRSCGNSGNSPVIHGTFMGSKLLYIFLITLHVVWFGMGVAKLVIDYIMEEKSRMDMVEVGGRSCGNSGNSPVIHGTFMGSKLLYIFLITLHVVWFGMGVAKLVIGAIYMNDCDREQMIPIWLIIDAFVPILFVVGFIPYHKESSSDSSKKIGVGFLVAGTIVTIAWSIVGGVFIYPNWNSDDGICDHVVATFAFVSMCTNWSLVGFWSQFVGRLTHYNCARRGQ